MNELADTIVLEHGKTRPEALAEIAKGLETLEYAIALPQLAQGKRTWTLKHTLHNYIMTTTSFYAHADVLPQTLGRILEVSRGVTCRDERCPLGVVACVVPL